MRKSLWAVLALLIMVTTILTACGGGGAASGKDPAAAAVENYLAAAVAKDEAKVTNLVCKNFQGDALTFMDGFQAVKAELKDVSCKNAGASGSSTQVTCTGSISMTYNTEKSSLDVSRQTYTVVQEGGDYHVCGAK